MTRVSDLSSIETPALSSVVPVSDGLLTKKATLSSLKNALLPPATGTILGGIKVGSGLTITNTGVLSVADFQAYSLPVATENRLGGIRVGDGLSMDNVGKLNLDYTLPTATSTVLGGIKIGEGLLSTNGVVSVIPPDTSHLNDAGLTVGNNDEIRLFVDVQTPTLQEDYRGLLNLSVRDPSVTGNYAKVRLVKSQISQLLSGDDAPAVYPIGENKKINLGLPTYEWGKVYADEFIGTVSQADSLKVGLNYRTASTSNVPDTIVARDSSGNISANIFTGNLTGNASSATNSEKADVDIDVTSTVAYATFVVATDGYCDLKVNPSMTYNAVTNTLNTSVTYAATAGSLASSKFQIFKRDSTFQDISITTNAFPVLRRDGSSVTIQLTT